MLSSRKMRWFVALALALTTLAYSVDSMQAGGSVGPGKRPDANQMRTVCQPPHP
jgi:hypothetical protein